MSTKISSKMKIAGLQSKLEFSTKRSNKKGLKNIKKEAPVKVPSASPEKPADKTLPESPKEESKENVQPQTPLSPKVEPISLENVKISSPVKPEKPEKQISASQVKSETTVVPPKVLEDLPCLPTPTSEELATPEISNDNEPKPKSKKKKDKKVSQDEDYTPPVEKSSKSKSSTKKQPKSTSKKGKKPIKEDPNQPKITDYLPFRRTKRVTATEKRKIEEDQIKMYLAKAEDDQLEHIVMKHVEGKGRGIFSARPLVKGEFVVEYAGDLLPMEEGKQREEEYSNNPEIGSYIYFFTFKGKRYCIDATAESGRYGRLLNHSKTKANCKTRLVEEPEDIPRLIIETKTDIAKDTELLYDYGDRSQEALKKFPWLAE